MALALTALIALALADAGGPVQAPPPVVLAAGDIADCNSHGDEQTATLLDSTPGTVLGLGDLAYESGSLQEFESCYGPTWGRHKPRTRPAPGNHEYLTDGAAGYYRYFGPAAGRGGKGYYSFNLGSWHIVSLNSERDTAAGGGQVRWLRRDLARHKAVCVLAFWHRPRWTSGGYGDHASVAPLWNALYDARADVVLSGHDHNYQRYAPMNKRGSIDRSRGMRSFVVGTGGRSFYALRPDPRRRAGNDRTFGILKLTLGPRSYRWRFVPVSGESYADSGRAACSPSS